MKNFQLKKNINIDRTCFADRGVSLERKYFQNESIVGMSGQLILRLHTQDEYFFPSFKACSEFKHHTITDMVSMFKRKKKIIQNLISLNIKQSLKLRVMLVLKRVRQNDLVKNMTGVSFYYL